MDLDFEDEQLATEVNSAVAMNAHWGAEWRAVSSHLVQLAACRRVAEIADLPGVELKESGGSYVISFPDGVVVAGHEVQASGRGAAVNCLIVTTVTWDGR